MALTDTSITLAALLKWEAPDGDVRLCDGGFLDYDSERYTAQDDVFGTVIGWEAIDHSFGDAAEELTLVFAPHPDATLTDWWRGDLENSRVRIWLGEVDSDGKTVSTATQLGDYLVDTITREQGPEGSDVLRVDLMGRAEKLFLLNEGNVCSDRFHQTVYPGELGFRNCTDAQQVFAWGVAGPSGGTVGGGGGVGGRGGGGGLWPTDLQQN